MLTTHKKGIGIKNLIMLSGMKNISNKLGGSRLSAKKLTLLAIAMIVVGMLIFITFLTLVIFVFRWTWSTGNSVVQQNQTVSSIVETTKQEVANTVPSVHSAARDYIVNGQIDAAKLVETYANLPAQTQQAWKAALENSITEAIQSAIGTDLAVLQQLLTAVRSL